MLPILLPLVGWNILKGCFPSRSREIVRLPVGVGQRSERLMAAMREGGKGIDHRELSPLSLDTLAECVEMLSCLAFDVDTG